MQTTVFWYPKIMLLINPGPKKKKNLKYIISGGFESNLTFYSSRAETITINYE